MKIFVYTKTKDAGKWFSSIRKGTASLEIHAAADLKKTEKKIPGGSVVYIDASSFASKDFLKAIAPLLKRNDLCLGIIDPKDAIVDVAELFHKGAADYLGKDLIKKGISAKRIEAVHSFKKPVFNESAPAASSSYIFSGRDWKNVKQGKDYTFCMMFIELDRLHEAKTSTFGDGQKNPSDIFSKFIDQQIESTIGKVWIWHDFGGVILFPFDGNRCDALLPALQALKEAVSEGQTLSAALQNSAQAAKAGMEATIPWVARKGRASYLGERSAGHQDPGATSSYMILKAAAEKWANC